MWLIVNTSWKLVTKSDILHRGCGRGHLHLETCPIFKHSDPPGDFVWRIFFAAADDIQCEQKFHVHASQPANHFNLQFLPMGVSDIMQPAIKGYECQDCVWKSSRNQALNGSKWTNKLVVNGAKAVCLLPVIRRTKETDKNQDFDHLYFDSQTIFIHLPAISWTQTTLLRNGWFTKE